MNLRPPIVFFPPQIEPKCCPLAGLLITWQEKDVWGPGKTGWAISYDMTHMIDVAFCPFCGTKLPNAPTS